MRKKCIEEERIKESKEVRMTLRGKWKEKEDNNEEK